MIAGYVLTLAAGMAAVGPDCPVIGGRYILGFETSYIKPKTGAFRGQKIWIENSNKLDERFKSAGRNDRWKSADVEIRGCVKAGRFGALGAYPLSIGSFDIVKFKAR